MVRRVLVCAAFATWSLVNCWLALRDPHLPYFLRRDPLRVALGSALAWEALVIIALLAAWEIGRRIPCRRVWFETAFLIACLLPTGVAATALASLSPVLTRAIQSRSFWPLALAAAAVPLLYVARHPTSCGRWARLSFLWSWPALAIIVLPAAWQVLRYPPAAYRDRPLAARVPASPRRIRVVWIIFDEMSQAIAFEHRPAGLELPNFDRLRRESFYATAAYAPGRATMVSLPALILGDVVTYAEPDGPADLHVRTCSRPDSFSWSSVSNIFDDARADGFNTALIGWYHPYCRLLNRSLTGCVWTPNGIDPGAEESLSSSPVTALLDRARLQIAELPLAGRIPSFSSLLYHRLVRIADFTFLRDRAVEAAADAGIGLVLIHLPVPHPPGIYKPASGRIDAAEAAGYSGNLALADRTLGELRRGIEQAGLWDRTAVIVSSDHGWRTALWRGTEGWTAGDEALASQDTSGIPFIVKLPGQTAALTYTDRFDTVVTRAIVNAILRGNLSTASQITDVIRRDSLANGKDCASGTARLPDARLGGA